MASASTPASLAETASATLFVALELSRSTWRVALHAPLTNKVSQHRLDGGDADGLLALITRKRSQAEEKLNQQGVVIEDGAMLLLRTDWPKGHDTNDPKWWNDSPYLTKEAAEWVVAKKPSVVGYDFAQEEKGTDYQKADQILESAMRVHRTILPKVVFQIENLINLDQIGPTAQVIALPAKWKTESAPARVIAILDN